MSVFGAGAMETLARSLWHCEFGIDAKAFALCDTRTQDRYRVKAVAMLVQVGEANREHLAQRVARSLLDMHAGDRDLAESIIRDVYGDDARRQRES